MNEPDDTTTPPSRRLNPFSLPSETDALFRLLVVAAWMVAITLSYIFMLALYPEAAMDDFVLAFDQEGRAPFLGETLPGALSAVVATLFLFGLAYTLYRSYPGRIRRRKQLEPLTPDRDALFYRSITQIIRQTELTPPPALEIGTGLSGLAFDYRPRPAIALDGSPRGLRLQLRRSPDTVQAIVLHEAGHIANRDVERSYFAQALWTAVVLLTVIPLLAWIVVMNIRWLANLAGQGQLTFEPFFEMVVTAARLAVMLSVVGLVRAQLLRTRELHADARAVTWGAKHGLLKSLASAAASERHTRSNAWRLHPLAKERIAAIENPQRLFRSTWIIPLVTGFLVGLVISGLVMAYLPLLLVMFEVTRWLLHGTNTISSTLWWGLVFLMVVGPLVLVAALIYGTLGLQVRRQTVGDLVSGVSGIRSYLRLIGPAILLVLGMEAGFATIPFGAMVADGWIEIVVAIPWMLMAGAATFLWLASYRYLVQRAYQYRVGGETARRHDRALAVVSIALLTVFLVSTLLVSRLAFRDGKDVLLGIAVSLVALLLSLVGYGIFFLISWFVFRVRSTSRTVHCPACGNATHHANPIAEKCETCNAQLAPWLVTS